jgi:ketosteroid isomerase-like protein
LGFALGLLASLFASVLFAAIPGATHIQLIAFLRNPALFLRTRLPGDERAINDLIRTLFDAWQHKDIDAYMACWSKNAHRAEGANPDMIEDREAIRSCFERSCSRYTSIRVPVLVLEDLQRSGTARAIATVYYRFELIRAGYQLPPVIEEAEELYYLEKGERDDNWLIHSNVDHFTKVTEKLDRAPDAQRQSQ